MQVLCTSNLTDAVDSAFLDRADIKAYIGLPSVQVTPCAMLRCSCVSLPIAKPATAVGLHVQARYEILRSCLSELQRVGLVAGGVAPHTWEELQARPLVQLHSSLPKLRLTDDACPVQRNLVTFSLCSAVWTAARWGGIGMQHGTDGCSTRG